MSSYVLSIIECDDQEMSLLSDAKVLGGIGAILVLLAGVPTVGWVLGIAGFVMILAAIYKISQAVNEKKIYNNMLTAVILAIVGVLVGSVVILPTLLSAFLNGYFAWPNFAPSASVTVTQWIAFGTTIGLGLLGAWVFFLASAVFLRRSYGAIGSKLMVRMFSTAGLLYLIGAASTIIGFGFLILVAAQILTAVAFFSIPTRYEELQAPTAPLQSAL